MRYSPNSWGAMLMAISMFSFVFNDGLMKVCCRHAIYQAIFLRGLVGPADGASGVTAMY